MDCGICSEEFDREEHEPRVLPCGHTVCLWCLQRADRRGKRECPTCNRVFGVPPRSLPTNFELLKRVKSQPGDAWLQQISGLLKNLQVFDQSGIPTTTSHVTEMVLDIRRTITSRSVALNSNSSASGPITVNGASGSSVMANGRSVILNGGNDNSIMVNGGSVMVNGGNGNSIMVNGGSVMVNGGNDNSIMVNGGSVMVNGGNCTVKKIM